MWSLFIDFAWLQRTISKSWSKLIVRQMARSRLANSRYIENVIWYFGVYWLARGNRACSGANQSVSGKIWPLCQINGCSFHKSNRQADCALSGKKYIKSLANSDCDKWKPQFVSNLQVGLPLQSDLNVNVHPFIIACGANKNEITHYYVVVENHLVFVSCYNFLFWLWEL